MPRITKHTMSDSNSTLVNKKRKRPPTFQHYPANRAKKLKQSWVEKQKIKSKWKAEKRREGLFAPAKPVLGERTQSDTKSGGSGGEVEDEDEDEASGDDRTASEAEALSSVPTPKQKGKDLKCDRLDSEKAQEYSMNGQTLREKSREAYSPASLHTFKSGCCGRGRSSTRFPGGSRSDRGAGIRGRGQPNMKLRMNVLLQNIQRNFA